MKTKKTSIAEAMPEITRTEEELQEAAVMANIDLYALEENDPDGPVLSMVDLMEVKMLLSETREARL